MRDKKLAIGRLKAWGYRGDETAGVARVVSAHGDYFHLICNEKETGETLARTKSSAFRDTPPPVTGDFVRFLYNPQGESRITEVLPRFSQIERLDPSSSGVRAQTLAVNFDTLFLVMSVNGNASPARLARFLALAKNSDCLDRVVLLITKYDLLVDETACAAFADCGVPVIKLSSVTGQGLAEVMEYVQPERTVAIVG